MKKILSMILAVGMMLSLLSIMPAQAEEENAAEYPYINLSFDEEGVREGFNTEGPYKVTWDEDGVAGSRGSLYCEMTGSNGDYSFNVDCPEILIGGTAKISCWVKIDTTKTKVKKDHMQFILWGMTPGVTSGQAYQFNWSTSTGKLNSGEWQYVEYIVDNWDGSMHNKEMIDCSRAVTVSPRLGGLGDTGVKKDAVAEDSPSDALAYWIDEFRIEPVPKTDDGAVEDDALFYDSCSGSKKVGGGSYNSGIGHDGKAGYASYTVTASQPTYADFSTPNLNIKANTWYKISVWAKADDAATVGDFVQFNLMRQSRLDKEIDSSNATDHPAPYAGNSYQMIRPEMKLTNDWQYVETYFKRNTKTFDNKSLSVWFRCGDDTKARKFSFDDFRIEEVGGAVTNGDFELEKSDIPVTRHSSSGDTAKDDYNRYGTFYGWHEVNATATVSSDVPANSEGTQSAKIVTSAANAEVHQGIFVENQSDTEFKFWAKGEGESVGKSIQVKLDRAVTVNSAKDVYDVPDTELLGEDLVLTDEWKEYTVRYTPDFKANGTVENGVIPRLPFMSIIVDGGAAGLTYYLDDITYEAYEEPVVEILPPKAVNVSVDGNAITDYEVYLYWELESTNDGVDNTFVRVSKILDNGQEATLAIEPLMYAYTIPEIAEGAKLRFDILPGEDTAEGIVYGDFVSVMTDKVKPALTVTPELGAFNEEAGSVTGKLFVENNLQDTLELFLVVALYDENDCAIRYEVKPVSVSTGAAENITVSVSTAAAEGFAPVAKAKAFVWGGTGVFDTDMTPYADVLVVEK